MSNNVSHFDFAKKPRRPSSFLFFLAKNILCKPDLKKRKAQIRKHGMEPYEGTPYLLLINHASLVDLNVMMMATHPHKVNNVMTLEGFRDFTEPLHFPLPPAKKEDNRNCPHMYLKFYCTNYIQISQRST